MFFKCTTVALISAFSVIALTVYLTPGMFAKMVGYAILDIQNHGVLALVFFALYVYFTSRLLS